MNDLSIDIETLGTLVDSQILSIGMAMFDIKTGEVGKTIYLPIEITDNEKINASLGTIKFWVSQAQNNPDSVQGLLQPGAIDKVSYFKSYPLREALVKVSDFVNSNNPENIWANGTKFDLGMLEYQFQNHNKKIPWKYNSDCCLRTLRKFAGNIDVDTKEYNLISHNALGDAIWQGLYISAACNKLGLI